MVSTSTSPQADLTLKSSRVQRRKITWRRKVCYTVFSSVTFFLILEGACSVAIVFKHAFFEPPLAERAHTEYDAELGWINKANSFHPNLYGPGIGLHTNAQRFRGTVDLHKRIPAGKVRVIVSGDSFALGYGVSDQQTWSAQLEAEHPQLQVVNQGQGGYGLDQAYLWYKRIRSQFDHDVHLMTFITPDFDRMPHRTFSGYGKPVLAVEKDQLVTLNTPVPRSSYWLSKVARNGIELQQLSTFRVARRLVTRPEVATSNEELLTQTRAVTAAIAQELQAFHTAHGSEFAFVHLPIHATTTDRSWHDFLQAESESSGWIYLDLTRELDTLTTEQRRQLFLQPGEVDYPGAAGHYSARGNDYIAELIYHRLMEVDRIAHRLRKVEQRSP